MTMHEISQPGAYTILISALKKDNVRLKEHNRDKSYIYSNSEKL